MSKELQMQLVTEALHSLLQGKDDPNAADTLILITAEHLEFHEEIQRVYDKMIASPEPEPRPSALRAQLTLGYFYFGQYQQILRDPETKITPRVKPLLNYAENAFSHLSVYHLSEASNADKASIYHLGGLVSEAKEERKKRFQAAYALGHGEAAAELARLAETDEEKAILLDEGVKRGSSYAMFQRAALYLKDEAKKEATMTIVIELLDTATTLGNADALILRAQLYARENDLKSAVSLFIQAHERRPKNPSFTTYAIMLRKMVIETDISELVQLALPTLIAGHSLPELISNKLRSTEGKAALLAALELIGKSLKKEVALPDQTPSSLFQRRQRLQAERKQKLQDQRKQHLKTLENALSRRHPLGDILATSLCSDSSEDAKQFAQLVVMKSRLNKEWQQTSYVTAAGDDNDRVSAQYDNAL